MYYECWLILTDSQSIGFLNHTDMDVSSKPVNVSTCSREYHSRLGLVILYQHMQSFFAVSDFLFISRCNVCCFEGRFALCRQHFFSFFLDMIFFLGWDKFQDSTHLPAKFSSFPRGSTKVGDIDAVDEEPRLARAADKGMAAPFIDEWPQKYGTQLGRLAE